MREDLEARLRHLWRPTHAEEAAVRASAARALGALPESDAPPLRSEVEPALLGRATQTLLAREDVGAKTKRRAAETLFDAVPLPDREDEVFLVPATVPPGLPASAAFLARAGEFGDYHLLHLIYALYLDPEAATDAPRADRLAILETVLAHETPTELKLLYAYLLLTSGRLGDPERAHLLSRVLTAGSLPLPRRRAFCRAVLAPDGGRDWFLEMARHQGLYPPEEEDREAVVREVRIRPLPRSLRPAAEAWRDGRAR